MNDHVNDHVNDQVEPISRAFQKLAFSLRNDRPFTCGQEVETERNQISCSRGQTNFHLALICHVSILIFYTKGEDGKASRSDGRSSAVRSMGSEFPTPLICG